MLQLVAIVCVSGHRKGQHTNLYKQMVECKVCNKHMQLKNLKAHMELVHEKVKNFSCEVCGKMFGTKFLVKEHMEIHKVSFVLSGGGGGAGEDGEQGRGKERVEMEEEW